MTQILIGSEAAKLWWDGGFGRESHDLDFWADQYPTHVGVRMDRQVDIFWDDRLWQYFGRSENRTATPDELYTMKVSHASWDLTNGSWAKHMNDIVFMKSQGCRLLPHLWDLLQEIWKDVHGKPRVNLNQESGQFFTDAVVRYFDHDSIHDTVAHYDRPLWMEVLKDGQTVAMDMAKVWALPFRQQVELFREEVYATALERWIIPARERGHVFSPTQAYHWALRKTITSLTKGRSSRFMIEKFDIFRDMPRLPDGTAWYMDRHDRNIDKLIRLEGM